ncbi:hypothetical protein D6C86_04315 [Aureobasidium pullulans]|uniref:Uncharacterized protein n=1 Tax=Aureobasidium pullulans TaxID=5580 RepID=A0A4S9YQH1_AURPU|nr:hypothetical protein D6C94_04394 [Aureobasidium pullulans]THZ37180.1 hypothetical protein D6C87_08668 [Aureobasidium pullulans]THZ61674.1 hypothetical protein D6C86_04315 [Aureobasidium pullulans]THZ96049.1 hypothetical protein D6C88_01721 [Aureobasidium pullulans]
MTLPLHLNAPEWFLQVNPNIGTRKDCIARSSALHIDSTTHKNRLSEAVTCDLYNFHPQRRNECVCFPIYRGNVTQISTVVHDMYKVFETTSVFYPPVQVVESCLLAAATQGPPTVCNSHKSKCPKSVQVVSREPRVLGGFPYCPTPGRQARQHLPARTLAESWKYAITSTSTSIKSSPTKDWSSLPTAATCEKNETRAEKKQCRQDMCMWGFLQAWMSPEVKAVTALDSNGVFLFATERTDYATMTGPHWGTVANPASTTTPWPTTTFKGKKTKTKSTYDTSMLKSVESHLKEIGMTELVSSKPTSRPKLVCHDEFSCREWCSLKEGKSFSRMMWLLGGGLAVTAVAGLGMALKSWGKHIGLRWRKSRAERRRKAEKDIQESESVTTDPGPVQGLELVRISPAGNRGRGRVRFQGDGADSTFDMSDGSDNGLMRVSDHESHLSLMST